MEYLSVPFRTNPDLLFLLNKENVKIQLITFICRSCSMISSTSRKSYALEEACTVWDGILIDDMANQIGVIGLGTMQSCICLFSKPFEGPLVDYNSNCPEI